MFSSSSIFIVVLLSRRQLFLAVNPGREHGQPEVGRDKILHIACARSQSLYPGGISSNSPLELTLQRGSIVDLESSGTLLRH